MSNEEHYSEKGDKASIGKVFPI